MSLQTQANALSGQVSGPLFDFLLKLAASVDRGGGAVAAGARIIYNGSSADWRDGKNIDGAAWDATGVTITFQVAVPSDSTVPLYAISDPTGSSTVAKCNVTRPSETTLRLDTLTTAGAAVDPRDPGFSINFCIFTTGSQINPPS